MLAYDAPDLADLPELLYSSSMGSSDDSDSAGTFDFSRGNTPDNSSIDTPSPVEPNHLSSYFRTPGQVNSCRESSGSSDADAPAIPTRAKSHTKKSHQLIARKRSVSRMTPPPSTLASPTTTRSSLDMFSSKPEANHPFGAELEQVNELAEEYCAREVAILDEEEQYLMSHGLCKFGVEDYVAEIEGMFGGVYEDRMDSMTAMWI